MTIIVAGSGPAGVFAALGALEAGAKVLMIDPGFTPDAQAQEIQTSLAAKPWKSWTKEDYAALKTGWGKGLSGLSDKKLFGSDFATRGLPSQKSRQKNCSILFSNARGGLSNIWGRGVEPPYKGEFEHWPCKEEFIASMRTVLSRIPFSAEEDNLAQVMPLYSENATPHTITGRSQKLLEKWGKHASALNAAGVHFGKTHLSFRQNCQYCGMCSYGCVYDVLFDTGQMIALLAKKYPHFSYRSGLHVKTFVSQQDEVALVVDNLIEEKEEKFIVKKLILACGAPQTTALTLRSTQHSQATLKTSELIKIPFVSIRGRAHGGEGFHALSQLTLTIDDRALTQRALVIHLFGKNPIITDAALALFPRVLHGIFTPLLDRLYIGMCFLHSEDSSVIAVENNNDATTFTGKRKPGTYRLYLKLLWHMLRHIRQLGLLPIPGLGGVGIPGSSVHYGASLVTDDNGQLVDSPSVYIADAASLPEIPAGSYTLSIMANAHRIGRGLL